jgi:BlaI family transcriptional regulator, penicillinase repressor
MDSQPESIPRPTDGELTIMRVLWRSGERTVRQVFEELNRDRDAQVVYTTVLKSMQIMHEKGLLCRNDSERSHVYRAAVPPEKTKRQMAADLMHRVFEGSARELVAHALGGRRVSKSELTEIRQLINELEARQK